MYSVLPEKTKIITSCFNEPDAKDGEEELLKLNLLLLHLKRLT